MITYGKWKFELNTFLYSGPFYVTISEKDGQYEFIPELPGMNQALGFEVQQVEVRENTIHIESTTDALPGGKTVVGDLTFHGETCDAVLQIPFLGKLEVKNGVRV